MIDLDLAPMAPPKLASLTPRTCLLCGRPTAITGVWMSPQRQIIIYALCGLHGEAADYFVKDIEDAIQELQKARR